MKGLDTNVLVRYLVRDDKKQAETASAFIQEAVDSGELIFINIVVLCELIWVLESAYGFHRTEIADVCEKILKTRQFEIESKEIVRGAINDYKKGKADFADYLIGRVNRMKGCDSTATFDRSLKNEEGFVVL